MTKIDMFKITNEKKTMARPPIEVEKINLLGTRDAMHTTLMTKLRLNRYDMRFMGNISQKYLQLNKQLSTGQNTLYEKIIHKYRKQLKKMGVKHTDLLALPWENGLVTLDTLNQKTFFKFTTQEGIAQMEMYFNFNKGRIDDVRALVHDDEARHLNRGASKQNFGNGQKYDFTWDNNAKVWHGPFNTYLFRTLYDFAVQAHVTIDETVQEFVSTMDARGSETEWTPSVREVHGRLYVNCIAETMLPLLDTFDATDVSVRNIERYSRLGLAPPESVANIKEYVEGVPPTHQHNIKTVQDVNALKEYIVQSDRKVLLYAPRQAVNFARRLSVSSKQTARQEKVLDVNDMNTWPNVMQYAPDLHDVDSIDAQSLDDMNVSTINDLMKDGYSTLITTVPYASLFRTQDKIGQFALAADKVIYISIEG